MGMKCRVQNTSAGLCAARLGRIVEFEARLSPVMRQEHRAGDKVFVGYSGKKIGITDPVTGVVRFAEIFVAVLGASSFTYCEAGWSWSQTLPD